MATDLIKELAVIASELERAGGNARLSEETRRESLSKALLLRRAITEITKLRGKENG